MSIFWEKKKKAKVHFAVSTTDAKKLGFLHTSRKWELRRDAAAALTREEAQNLHKNSFKSKCLFGLYNLSAVTFLFRIEACKPNLELFLVDDLVSALSK